MAVDFPNSPSVGDIFQSGDRTYIWDGTTWSLYGYVINSLHAATHEDGGTDEVLLAQSQVVNLTTDLAGKASTTDPRFTDARTPLAHAATHASAGTDPITIAPSQVSGTAVVTGDTRLITFCTSSTRPSSPVDGQMIYETDTNTYYGWKDSAWLPIGGGATGGGTDDVFYENRQTVTTNYTITSGKNAMSAGPITINNGVTVTVPSGSVWVII